jgi:hypothetical protein
MMNIRYPSDWLAKAEESLNRLAETPWALFLVLVSVNTLAEPYAGIYHDARLYSVQVLNRVEEGTYAEDLFFRYGSQDEYSLFSRLAAPLVAWLGLPAAFFLIYLVSKSLLIWGMMRLMQTLVPNRIAAVVALIYAMAIPMHYGGQHILNVQESFLTPRTPGCALVLIGLNFLLRGRPLLSGLMIALALGVHPLMAFGGLMVWTGYYAWKYGGAIFFASACAAALGLAAVVLCVEPLGTKVFGEMDDVWRQTIMHASSFNFPSQWSNGDWCYLALQLALLGMAIWRLRTIDKEKVRFLVILLLVSVVSAAGAVLAEELPYALLLQGQPYRGLWLLGFIHLGLAWWFTLEWLAHPSVYVQLAGCGLFTYLCCTNVLGDEYVLLALLLPVLILALRGLERTPRDPAWLRHSFVLSLVVGELVWVAYKFFLLTR